MAQPTLIDIDRILANKMGTKSRFVPGFLVRYLKTSCIKTGSMSSSRKKAKSKVCNG